MSTTLHTNDCVRQRAKFGARSRAGDVCSCSGITSVGTEMKQIYTPTIQEAFRAWVERRAYVDNGRNYRLRLEPATPTYRPSGKVAPWNKEVKRLFPSCAEFHLAATKFIAEHREDGE